MSNERFREEIFMHRAHQVIVRLEPGPMIGQFGFDWSREGASDHSCVEGVDDRLNNAVEGHPLAFRWERTSFTYVLNGSGIGKGRRPRS